MSGFILLQACCTSHDMKRRQTFRILNPRSLRQTHVFVLWGDIHLTGIEEWFRCMQLTIYRYMQWSFCCHGETHQLNGSSNLKHKTDAFLLHLVALVFMCTNVCCVKRILNIVDIKINIIWQMQEEMKKEVSTLLIIVNLLVPLLIPPQPVVFILNAKLTCCWLELHIYHTDMTGLHSPYLGPSVKY